MSLINQLECLEASGLITNAQLSRIKKVSMGLPNAEADLLTIIAAVALSKEENLLMGTPLGTQSISSTGTVDVKTLTVPAGATRAVVSIHTNNIIFRTDGVAPILTGANVGLVNTSISIGNLSGFKFAGQAATAAIFVTYY